jgi:RHS repeat-associated protein
MFRRVFLLSILMFRWVFGQTPQSNITFPNPTPNPANLAVDSYTRASTNIVANNGFAYSAASGSGKLLNLNISSYPPYVNNNYQNPATNPTYYSHNPNLEAGVTEGIPSVDASGAFNYDIPIICSPGTAGIQPHLSVSYNSNGSNNWLGLGFNLSGISRITRTGNSVFYDGRNGGVKFNANDKFALDGTRLLAKTGIYGQTATYKTPIESYDIISSFYSSGNASQYFTVTTPDGVSMEFGNSANSKCFDKSGAVVLAWYINKVYDIYGNYMTYSYTNTDGEILIERIDYTGNGNNPTYNKIEFSYMERSDDSPFFIAGKEFGRKHVIKSIISKDINNSVVKKYDFDYFYKLGTKLSKITEVDAKGNQLNPTYFEWSNSGISSTYRDCSALTPQDNNVPYTPLYNLSIPADLNGDGKKDLLMLNTKQGITGQVEINTYGPSYCGSSPTFNSPLRFVYFGNAITLRSSQVDYISSFVFDEDDDDVEEVFVFSGRMVTLGSYRYYIDKVKIINGVLTVSNVAATSIAQSFFYHWNGWGNNNAHKNLNSSVYFYAYEDVTGDNLKDLILSDQSGITVTPSGGQPIFTPVVGLIKTAVGDFDGDGIKDIYALGDLNLATSFPCFVLKYDQVNNVFNTISSATQFVNIGTNPHLPNWSPYSNSAVLNNFANASKSIDFGDFNGDGKTDLMFIQYLNATDAKAYVLKSDGTSFLPDNNPLNVPVILNWYEANYSAMDLNNDGFSDLVLSSYDVLSKLTNFDHYPSDGSRLTASVGSHFYHDSYVGALADFNGDGCLDYVAQNLTSTFKTTFSAFNQNNKNMVKRIFNIQNDIKVSYAYLADFNYVKTNLSNSDPVFKNIRQNIFVTKVLSNNNRMSYHSYNNCVVHNQGKGFIGFEKVSVRDAFAGGSSFKRGTVSSYIYSSTYDDVIKIENTDDYFNEFTPAGGQTAAYSKTEFNYTQTGTNRFLNSTIISSKNYLKSTFNIQTKTFDNNNGGNILSEISSNVTWLSQQTINSVQYDYLYQTANNPINSAPYFRNVKLTETRSGNNNSSVFVTDRSYNNQYLSTIVRNSNHGQLASTISHSQHNVFGEALSTSLTAPDLNQARTSQVQYDATGRFVIQSTDALGKISTAVYEPSLGNIKQSTDITGLVTKFEYDGLGRVLKIIEPTGAVNTKTYEWYSYISNVLSGPSWPQEYGLKITNNDEGNGQSIIYHDRSGNVLKTEQTGFGGNTVVTKNIYNVRNQLAESVTPHFSSQSIYLRCAYSYDFWDRLSTKNLHNNNTGPLSYEIYTYNNYSTDAIYNKGSVTVQNLSGNNGFMSSCFKTVENNEAGQAVRIVNYDNSNFQNTTADYTYNQLGLPTQVVTAFPGGQGGATTTFNYDPLGRRSVLVDPSSGTTLDSYNSIGELLQRTRPNSQYTYTYDILGRLLTKTGFAQGTYSYDYMTSGNGLEQIKKITGPSEITEFRYDNFNRPIEKKETIGSGLGSKVFTSNYTFNKYNQLIDYTYPGNFKITNEYDGNGFLTKIKNNNNYIWQLNSMKSPNLVENFTNYAGIATQSTYDNLLNLATKSLGNINLQTYVTSATSHNLLSQTYQNFGSATDINEGFEYDALNRLKKTKYTDSNNNTITKHVYNYNPNGNLSYKQDCGNYVYGNSNKPYLLTQIQNATNNNSLNTLNVSYTDFDKVSQIIESVPNNPKEFGFVYGNAEQRIKMEYKLNSQLQFTRYYQDNYDREETSNTFREWSYIYSPFGLTAVYYNDNGTGKIYDINTDQLGSPVLLTGVNGQIIEEYSFDAWGRRRNPNDWTYTSVPQVTKMIRGYTGHEHLDEVNMINMNGRIYDPVLGRFVQPDCLVQDPVNIQSMNRYSYCLNNPVNHTDPSGYKIIPQNSGVSSGPSNTGNSGGRISAPVLYVDGIRIEAGTGGYDTYLGGGSVGGSVAKIKEYGVWTGVGPGLKGLTTTMAGLLDAGKLFKTETILKTVRGSEFIKANPELASDLANLHLTLYGAIEMKAITYNQDAIDGANAQSGGGGFMDGLINAPGSNMGSGSSFVGYAGLQMDKTKSLLQYTAKNSTGWANKATALNAAKVVSKIGKGFGIAGAVFTGVESALDGNGFSLGDGVKVGIGLLTTFTPLGWAYGIADIGVGVFTGTTITDRIGNGIDNGFK